MSLINESGLYSLIFKANKPEAKPFPQKNGYHQKCLPYSGLAAMLTAFTPKSELKNISKCLDLIDAIRLCLKGIERYNIDLDPIRQFIAHVGIGE